MISVPIAEQHVERDRGAGRAPKRNRSSGHRVAERARRSPSTSVSCWCQCGQRERDERERRAADVERAEPARHRGRATRVVPPGDAHADPIPLRPRPATRLGRSADRHVPGRAEPPIRRAPWRVRLGAGFVRFRSPGHDGPSICTRGQGGQITWRVSRIGSRSSPGGGSGLGRATAQLLRRGGRARSPSSTWPPRRPRRWPRSCADGGAKAQAYTVDVSDPASVEAAVAAVAVGPGPARRSS